MPLIHVDSLHLMKRNILNLSLYASNYKTSVHCLLKLCLAGLIRAGCHNNTMMNQIPL